VVSCEPTRHGRDGSRPLEQRWAAHVAQAQRTRMNRGGGGRSRRVGSG
jgi:hypothetical protein